MPRRKKFKYDPFADDNPGDIGRVGPNKDAVKNSVLQSSAEKEEAGLIEGGSIASQANRPSTKYQKQRNILGAPISTTALGDILKTVSGVAGAMGVENIDSIADGINKIGQAWDLREKGVKDVADIAVGAIVDEVKNDLPEIINQYAPDWAGYIPDPNDAVGVYLNNLLAKPADVKDMDADGDIDAADMAISRAIGSLSMDVKKINPILLKMQNDKYFHHRVIRERNLVKQKKSGITNQVTNVEQGLAKFDKELNRFNVRY